MELFLERATAAKGAHFLNTQRMPSYRKQAFRTFCEGSQFEMPIENAGEANIMVYVEMYRIGRSSPTGRTDRRYLEINSK
jgi:hypothetical protein